MSTGCHQRDNGGAQQRDAGLSGQIVVTARQPGQVDNVGRGRQWPCLVTSTLPLGFHRIDASSRRAGTWDASTATAKPPAAQAIGIPISTRRPSTKRAAIGQFQMAVTTPWAKPTQTMLNASPKTSGQCGRSCAQRHPDADLVNAPRHVYASSTYQTDADKHRTQGAEAGWQGGSLAPSRRRAEIHAPVLPTLRQHRYSRQPRSQRASVTVSGHDDSTEPRHVVHL
jgi:hypothetical protein